MDLLTAVNMILPALGENIVTSVDTRHPTVAIILQHIDAVRRNALTQGYWFNTFTVTLHPEEGTKNIRIPKDTLAFSSPLEETAVRGGLLLNRREMSTTWDRSVKGELRSDVTFEDLPESVAQYVLYTALGKAYAADIGYENILQVWEAQANDAYLRLMSEHLRNQQYSTRRSPRYRALVSALRG